MTDMKDGGPAFPVPGLWTDGGTMMYPQDGMSLRDWFAGQALAGIITDCSIGNDSAAKVAYVVADAMLRAREQSK